MRDKLVIIFILFSLLLFLLFGLINTLYGRMHVDEGFYFITPYLVFKGMVPYRDFIYTQAPLHSYIYSLVYYFFSEPSFWLTRIVSLFFGFMSIILGIDLARRLSGLTAASIAAGLLCFNGFLTYFFSMGKLYPVTAFFVMLGLWLFITVRKKWLGFFLATLSLGIATGIRISVLPALPVLLFMAVMGQGIKSREFWVTLLGSILVLSLVLGPFLINYSEQFIYSVLLYNYTKDVHPFWMMIMLRLDVISKLSYEFFLFVILSLLMLSGLLYFILEQNQSTRFNIKGMIRRVDNQRWTLWLVVMGVGGLQAVSKSGVVDEYLVPIVPLVAAMIAVESVNIFQRIFAKHINQWILIPFFLACFVNLAAYGRTSLTLMDGKSPIKYIDEVSEYIKQQTKPDDFILSYNNTFVIEAGRRIVPGYEMHVATNDPDWDEQRCELFRVLKQTQLEQMLKNQKIAMVIMAENSFIGRFPEFYNPGEIQMREIFLEILRQNYVKIKRFHELGYFNTDVDIYKARRLFETNRS